MSNSEGAHKVMSSKGLETEAFANRRKKNRSRAKLAKASRRKNRGR